MRTFLLCNKISDVLNDHIQQHYQIYHGVDKNNLFFFFFFCRCNFFANDKRSSALGNCFRCERFLLGSRDRKIRKFFHHYPLGGTLPFENRPVNISRIDGIIIYSISFDQHQISYNFFDSDERFLNFF